MTNIEDLITVNSFKFWDINFRGLNKINVRGYWLGLGLCCLTPLSTIFQLDRSSYNVVSSTYRLSGVRTHNVSGDRY
jgi:hypothetical protein